MTTSCIPTNGTGTLWNFGRSKTDPITTLLLIVDILGLVGNSLMACLLKRHALGARLPTILFRTQAALDLFVNLESIIFGLTGELWNIEPMWLNHVLCRFWLSQFVFWLTVQLSIGNLVLIGMERYVALCFPLFYQRMQPNTAAIVALGGNLLYNLLLAFPMTLETQIQGNCCVTQHYLAAVKRLLFIYSIIWFVFVYLIALIMLIIFYGGVVLALRRSALMCRTRQRSDATIRFTKMAIVITGVYVVCVSYDAFAYLTGRTGLWSYQYSTIWHRLGVLSVSVNSFANPYIYYLVVLQASCPKRRKLEENNDYAISGDQMRRGSALPTARAFTVPLCKTQADTMAMASMRERRL